MTDARIVATYDYTDEDGNLLYRKTRYDGKRFVIERADGDKLVRGLADDTRRVLYRLPRVTAAKASRVIFLTEGEKDADALDALGLVATCNPNGSSEWRDNYTEQLRGAIRVFVVADCDAPGRKHARDVAEHLHAAGIPVHVIDLAPERDDKYDVSDFILAHGDAAKDALKRLANRAPRWPGVSRIKIASVSSFLADQEPYDRTKDYLGPLLHGGYRMLVLGPTGHGKTTLVMEMCGAAARGTEFLGFVGAGVPVLYLNLELPGELFAQALRDARLDGDVPNFAIGHLPLGLHLDVNKDHRRELEEMIEPFKVVVLDPWAKAIRDELEYDTIRGVIAYLDGLRNRHADKCMIINAHTHLPANRKERVSAASQRGFKMIQDQTDMVLTFQRTGRNESQVLWDKSRSPVLGVTNGDTWDLRWRRGEGFVRSDVIEGQQSLEGEAAA